MKDIYAFLASVVAVLLSFMTILINEDESFLLFLLGIVIACIGIFVSTALIKAIAKNINALFIIVTLIHFAISIYFVFNIVDILSFFSIFSGFCVGFIIATGSELYMSYLLIKR